MKHIQTWGDNVFRPSINNRKTLKDIPFSILANAANTGEWAADNTINKKMTWVLPQLYALVGNFKLSKNSEGKIDGQKFWGENLDIKDPANIGIYRFFQIHPRGQITTDQNKPDGRPYCRLVPLVLSAVKQMQGIPYSAWDRDTLHYVVDPDLCSAMLDKQSDYTREELLVLRVKGLTIKSGDNAGGIRNPTTYAKIHATGDEDFDTRPDLWKIMATQIWVAHPANRLDCMVLDPGNWDAMPDSLIPNDFMSPTPCVPKQLDRLAKKADLPWG